LEARVTVERDEQRGERGVNCAPNRDGEAGEKTGTGDPAGAAERRADEKGPEEKIRGEKDGNPAREPGDPSAGDRFTGGELPAGETFGQDKFQRSGDCDGPEQRGAEFDAGDGGDNDVAGADPSGGKDDTGAEGAETLEQGHGV